MSTFDESGEWPAPSQMKLVQVDREWVFRFVCDECGARLISEHGEQDSARQAFEEHLVAHFGPARFKWGATGYYVAMR